MSIVTLSINNKTFKIGCPPGKEADIQNSANKLSEMIGNLKESSPGATTEFLLLLAAVSLRYEIDNINNENKFSSDTDTLNEVLGSLNDVTDYLETLAKKL